MKAIVKSGLLATAGGAPVPKRRWRLLDGSTPAKLRRSLLIMWLLLIAALAATGYGWYTQHDRLTAMKAQAEQVTVSTTLENGLQVMDQLCQSLTDYQVVSHRLEERTIAMAAVLLLFVAWRYLFILRRGHRAILQGTLVTFLLCGLVCGYALVGQWRADTHVSRAVSYAASAAGGVVIGSTVMIPPADAATSFQTADFVEGKARLVQAELGKAEGQLKYVLPAAAFLFLLAGLFYKLAVYRSSRDYQ